MFLFIQQVLNGIMLGSVYSLVALGLTLEYGILHSPNFTHGALYMAGAYVTFLLATSVGLNFWLAMVISMIALALIGIVIERLVYRPLMLESPLSSFIAAIGMIFIFVDGALHLFGPDFKRFPPVHAQVVQVLGTTITLQRIIIILVTVALIVLLHFFIKKTTVGATIEATAQDMEGARLMGINVNRTIVMTFAIGSSLAAIAALMYIAQYPKVYTTMGSMLGLKAFVAAVLGGIGIIPGAMLGGFVIGLVESFTTSYVSSSMADAFVFLILIIVLIIKPAGILGKNMGEKV